MATLSCVVALYFRFPTYLYLKLRFVSNDFWAKNPKTSHCAPMHFFAFAFAVLKSWKHVRSVKGRPPFQRKKTRNSTWSRKPITFFAKLHGYILHMYYIGRLLPILCSQFELWILAFELKVNLQLWSWMLIRIENKKICTKSINYVYKIFYFCFRSTICHGRLPEKRWHSAP